MFVIIGANGFLGSYIQKNLLEMTDENILSVAKDIQKYSLPYDRVEYFDCDILNIEDIKKLNDKLKDKENIKIIYLVSAFNTKKNLSIEDTKNAFNLNIIALSNFLYYINKIDKFYFTSSDMIFNEDGLYNEDSKISPMNQYGEHKIICEKIVNSFNFNVVRMSVMMGPSLSLVKKHFVDDIINNIKNGESMEFFADVFRTMLDFNTASQLIIKLINNDEAQQYKIVNISGDESLSKYDMAIKIAEKYNLDKNKIIPIKQADSNIWNEKRANKILLDNTLLKKILNLNNVRFSI